MSLLTMFGKDKVRKTSSESISIGKHQVFRHLSPRRQQEKTGKVPSFAELLRTTSSTDIAISNAIDESERYETMKRYGGPSSYKGHNQHVSTSSSISMSPWMSDTSQGMQNLDTHTRNPDVAVSPRSQYEHNRPIHHLNQLDEYPFHFKFPRDIPVERKSSRKRTLSNTSSHPCTENSESKERPHEELLSLIRRSPDSLVNLHCYLEALNLKIKEKDMNQQGTSTDFTQFIRATQVDDNLAQAKHLVKVLEKIKAIKEESEKEKPRIKRRKKSSVGFQGEIDRSTGMDVMSVRVRTSSLTDKAHTQEIDLGGLNTELSIRHNVRCRQCDSKETPEWRRGPHGSRTLCNACGLFYSKLVKRVGTSEADQELKVRKSEGRVLDRRTK